MIKSFIDSESVILPIIHLPVVETFPNILMNFRQNLGFEKMKYLSVMLVVKLIISKSLIQMHLFVQNVAKKSIPKKLCQKLEISSNFDHDFLMPSDSNIRIEMVRPKISSWGVMVSGFLDSWALSQKKWQILRDSSGLPILPHIPTLSS